MHKVLSSVVSVFLGLGTGFEQQIMLRRNPGSGTWLDFGHHRPKAMAQQ
jgi:hypothetical protein